MKEVIHCKNRKRTCVSCQ